MTDDITTSGGVSQPTETTGSGDTTAVQSESNVQPGTSGAKLSSAPDADSPQVEGSGATSPPPLEPPTMSADGGMGALILMMTKLRSSQMQDNLQGMVKSINNRINMKSIARQDQLDQLEKSRKAQDKAKKSGSFAKTFGWIGKALTVVAAVAVAVLLPGAGLALAALMIGGLILNEVMQIPAVQGAISKALGPKGALALTIAIAAVQLIGAIALTVMTGGAGGVALAADIGEMTAEGGEVAAEAAEVGVEAGTEGAEGASEAAEDGSEAASESGDLSEGDDLSDEGDVDPEAEQEPEPEEDYGEGDDSMNNDDEGGDPGGSSNLDKLQTGARVVRVSAKVGADSEHITADVEDMQAAGYQKTADKADAQADKYAADIKKQAAYVEQTDQLIQTLLKRLEDVFSTCSQVISSEHKTNMSIAQGMSLTSNV